MAETVIRPLDYISTRNQTDISRAPGMPGVHLPLMWLAVSGIGRAVGLIKYGYTFVLSSI